MNYTSEEVLGVAIRLGKHMLQIGAHPHEVIRQLEQLKTRLEQEDKKQ